MMHDIMGGRLYHTSVKSCRNLRCVMQLTKLKVWIKAMDLLGHLNLYSHLCVQVLAYRHRFVQEIESLRNLACISII